MPTDRRVSRAPSRLTLAHWALTLLALVAGLLGGAVPARGAPAVVGVVHRHGRRVARLGSASAPSIEPRTIALRAASLRVGTLHGGPLRAGQSLASFEGAAGTRAHQRTAHAGPHGAPHLAPCVPRHVDASRSRRVRPARPVARISAPGRRAPSSRAPPLPIG